MVQWKASILSNSLRTLSLKTCPINRLLIVLESLIPTSSTFFFKKWMSQIRFYWIHDQGSVADQLYCNCTFLVLKSIQQGLWPCVCCDPTNTWCKRVLCRPQWCILSDVPLLNAMSFDGTIEGTKRVKHATTRSIEACSSRCKFPTLFRCFFNRKCFKN